MSFLQRIQTIAGRSTHIAPLAVFRVVYGAVMTVSAIRFLCNGWVHEFYGVPKFFFPYYGFEWIKPVPEQGMWWVFVLMAFSFFMVMLGAGYRLFSVIAFLTFTYTELIDKTNYLNHYYFISLISFLMLFLPAHRFFSVDSWLKPSIVRTHIPAACIYLIQLQLGIVYVYAGLAKINPDWLLEAMPLKIWMTSRNDLPLIGSLLDEWWIPYAFSWFGMLYDLSVPFMLLSNRFRIAGYILVMVFHVMTRVLFQIGMFPFVMIGATLIFFPASFHLRLIHIVKRISARIPAGEVPSFYQIQGGFLKKATVVCLIVYVSVQLLFPFRSVAYPGHLFWTEQGYRFSWRVMLMEKAGVCFFTVRNPANGAETEIDLSAYLTPLQEKMMSTQPDMILQFAHHLSDEYKARGVKDPEVRVLSYVSLNGAPGRLFIDPHTNLAAEKESFKAKSWILSGTK